MRIDIHTTELKNGMAIEADVKKVEGENTYHHTISAIVGLASSLIKDTTATKEDVAKDFLSALECCEDTKPAEEAKKEDEDFPAFMVGLLGQMLDDEKFMAKQTQEFQNLAKKAHSQMTDKPEPNENETGPSKA